MAELLFYLLAALAVGAGVGVIAARNPLFSLLSLLGAFFCLACIYLLAGFQFLAATQLLVYAGAIMVLFLFVIMLLNLADESQLPAPASLGKRHLAIASGAAGLLLLVGTFSVGLRPVAAAGGESAAEGGESAAEGGEAVAAAPEFRTEEGLDDLQAIGELLFSRFVLPFEAASLLLLATMIAVILLAKRQRDDSESGWPWKRGAGQ